MKLQLQTNSKSKKSTKVLETIYYGQQIYLKNLSEKIQQLWGRGFMDKNVYLSCKSQKLQAQFTIQPKKGLYSFQGKTTTPVVFGAEVLIKHVLSQYYLAISEHDQMPVLEFQEQESSSCYFQFVPSRSFQSNGNTITADSIFVILNSQRKLYITDLVIESLPKQPSSPSQLSKRISKQQPGIINNLSQPRSFSGSVAVIAIELDECKRNSELMSIQSSFKKKSIYKNFNHMPFIEEVLKNQKHESQNQANDSRQKSIFQLNQSTPKFSRTSSLEQQPYQFIQHQRDPSYKQKSQPQQRLEIKKQKQQLNLIPNYLLNVLPIYSKQKDIVVCNVENYSYSEWCIYHVNSQLRTEYLNNYDYIYFTHSLSNQIVTLDIEKYPAEVSYVKNTYQSENQYILSSIFIVQIYKQESKKFVYLKHLLTDKYFTGKKVGEHKVNCQLIPLLTPKKNQYPPFKIMFDGQILQKGSSANQKYNLHGYWLNKISRTQIAQIMSLQNIQKHKAIQYLNNYLKNNTRRGQKILREFLFIPKLINQLSNLHLSIQKEKNIKSYYQILFSICRNNQKNKKQCLKFIQQILKHPQKLLILDLLTQLLIDNSNTYAIEKYITPTIIQDQIREFIKGESYSISFMRIFRVFCGSDQQPSMRNQCLLFNLFFWGNPVKEGTGMTESVVQTQKKIQLPSCYKFKIFQQEGNIYFSNGIEQQKYENMRQDIINYLRQYLYLLSDCMNGNNYHLIRTFVSVVSFDLLLKLLEKKQMKGPVLSLIYNAYLKPQKKYKPHIYHKDYEKICQKGGLISYCSNQQQRLRQFIDTQIRENKDYNSTIYRILLNVFKQTIQNGYWRKFDELIDLMNCLDGVLKYPQSQNTYHETYQQKANDRNLLKSKIASISIKIMLIDMQVSLWASDYASGVYTQSEIQRKLIDQIKHSKNWVINQKILRLCSTESPQLLRKAVLLLYKIYNLYKLAHKTYEQAQIETQSIQNLTDFFSILQIKQEIKSQNYTNIILACVKDASDWPSSSNFTSYRNLSNLSSIFGYRQVNQEVQNMTYKLGLHDMLINDVKRYFTLSKRLRQQQSQIIYSKLLTLYAIIRNNLKLRDIISEHRKIFIPFLQSQISHSYVAADIIQQIYRNNRKLIISDNQQLINICRCIDVVQKNTKIDKIDLRFSKLINLLSVFIQTGNRKIVDNHQIILKYVFTRSFVSSVIDLMKSSSLSRKQNFPQMQYKQEHFRNVIQIVIYDLLVTMAQKKLLSYFERPSNQMINLMLLRIGMSNWGLKSKAFLCINFTGIKQQEVVGTLRMILFDLNFMCESLKVSDQQQLEISKEVKIYISNITKILDTIDSLLKVISKNLTKQSQEEIIVIKIIQRLFIMKSYCPQIVHKKIDNLLQFISIIENRLKRKNQYYELTKSLKKIQIKDFQRNQIKDKLPLIYGDKIKNKEQVIKINLLEQKNSFVEEIVKKKIKISGMNKNSFQMTQDMIKELKTLVLNLSNVNKSDSSLLSDNIKQFLIYFLRVSFLEVNQEQLVKMQDILVTYQVPTIVCSILEQPFKNRYKLFSSTFELGIKLLQGGHSKCQQKFLQKFKEDGKNWIFQNIYQIIFDSLATIEFYYHDKEDPTIKSYQMMLQLQEYYTCREQRKLSCQLLANSFRFLQLLCQNDNHVMKDYIYNQIDKEQHIKNMTKNFIQVAQRIMDGVFAIIEFNIRQMRKMPDSRFEQQVRSNVYNLPIYILDFLIEVCQIPAQQNQLYLCRTDFLDFVKKLIDLRKNTLKHNQQDKDWTIFFIYQKKLIILLKSLLQQNSQQISSLLKKKIGNEQFQFFIQQSFIHGGLQDIEKLKQLLTEMHLNSYVENIVDILIVKKILKVEDQMQFEPEKLKIINQLNNRIQSISVDFKTHSLTVYFPFHPLFSLLSKKTKDFMLDRTASLTTRRQKLTELLISRQVIYQDINQQKNSQKKLLNQQKMEYLFNFLLFLCYLIILLLVLFYSVGKSGAVLDLYEAQIISGLSYMQLLVSAIYAILLGFNTYPVAKQKVKTHEIMKRRLDPKYKLNSIQIYFRRLKSIYIDQSESTHTLILLIISIYACFFEVRVYSFSLIFVFAKIQLLQSILKSIRLTWQQLIFVCLLALAFSFIFGFITLNYYIGPLYENQQIDIDIDRINEHCNSIITCVSSLYTQKIIGQSVSRQDQQYNYGRFISDLIYWGFFQILLSNIIAAIIIDKFAQQRNAKQKIQHERYSKCYICFADKSTLERRGQDFMSHVNNVHNIWNYLFYMYTLQNLKDITDFTGIQYWINHQVKQNQIDWIPIDDTFKDEDVSLHELLEKLKPIFAQKQIQEKLI